MKRFVSCAVAFFVASLGAFSLAACARSGENDNDGQGDQMIYPVYLIIGQSNASGNGRIADLDDGFIDKEYDGVSIYCDGTANASVKERIMKVGTKTGQGSINTGRFGAEIGIAEYFSSVGYKAGLIKCGFDGSSINLKNTSYGSWWTNLSEIPSTVTKCYDRFLFATVTALNAFEEQGLKPRIKGVIWLQGESNAYDASYRDDLDALIAKIRSDLSIPDLYFVAGTISYVSPGKYSYDCSANQAIRALADKPFCDFIESGRFATNPDDAYHWTGENLVEIGKEFAEKLYEKAR